MKVILTGATGFLGSKILNKIIKNHTPVVVGRKKPSLYNGEFQFVDFEKNEFDNLSMQGVDIIIHAAGRAHIMNDSSSDPLAQFRKINVDATIALAKKAIAANVKRFIFISSVKVNGEVTSSGAKFSSYDKPNPTDYYSLSKFEAENKLLELANNSNLEVVIIRPPLIYGEENKGNILSLSVLISKGFPLPFLTIKNKRSIVSINNLISLIEVCMVHHNAKNKIFLVSDGVDISTTKFIQLIGFSIGKKARLFPFPLSILRIIGLAFNKSNIIDRLFESLQVDISPTIEALDWHPPYTTLEEFTTIRNNLLNKNKM